MKAEITPENRAKFFAQYWGQNIFHWKYPEYSTHENVIDKVSAATVEYANCGSLLLKPLSSISDEDAIEVAKIACPELFHTRKSGHYVDRSQIDWISVKHDYNYKSVDIDIDGYVLVCDESDGSLYERNPNMVHAIDYLRSKGYALPWMGLTAQEMVEAGWIKLIEP